MTRQLLVLSTIALLLVGLWAVQSGSDSDASVPEPARLEYTVPEDGAADVTLAASHVDGLPGCTELEFATDNVTNGALDPLTDLPCAEGATLTAVIDESAAALPVVTTTGFPAAGILRIGDEIVTYTSKTDSSFNGVTRGAAGTNAAPHDAGDTVSQAEEENAPLDMNHNDVETTIVLSGTGLSFPPAGVIQVGNELITYGSAIEVDDTTELGAAVRGAFNTTAAGHLTGDIAYLPPNFATTLTDDIATPQTTIPVASVAGLTAPQGAVAIGDEMISYTGVGMTSEDCSPATEPCLTGAARGLGASDPADHSSGDGVFQLSGVDTDAATTTFTLDAEFFGIAGQLSDDIPDTAILVPATAPSSSLVTAFPDNGTAAIDDEVFSYTSIETAAENCDPLPAPCFAGVVRGQQGTAAAAHSAGADIYQAFFSYTAAHEPGAEPSFVGIIATPENDPPTTTDHGAELADANQTLQQLISAQDLDGDSGTHAEGDCELGFTIETEPAAGVIEEIVNNDCSSSPPNTDGVPNEDSATVTYNPDDGFAGEDSFTVRACDDNGCAVSTVTVLVGNVTPTPEPTPTPSPTPPPPTPLPWAHGDIDCDGDVDAVDALAILLVLAGFPPLESDEPDCPTPGDEPPTSAPTPPPTPTPSPTPTPAPTPTDTPTPTPNPSPSATPS